MAPVRITPGMYVVEHKDDYTLMVETLSKVHSNSMGLCTCERVNTGKIFQRMSAELFPIWLQVGETIAGKGQYGEETEYTIKSFTLERGSVGQVIAAQVNGIFGLTNIPLSSIVHIHTFKNECKCRNKAKKDKKGTW